MIIVTPWFLQSNVRNQVVSSLVWLWWVIDLVRFEFEPGTVSFYFSFIFVSFGESCLLVSWCAGGRCDMTYCDEDRGRSSRPSAEDRGWSHRSGTRWSGGREVGWRRVRSTPDMWRLGARFSWLSLKTKVDGLWVVWPQPNHSDGFCRFDLKTVTEPPKKWGVYLPRSYRGILDEARMRKHTQISIQYQIWNSS
jgi:hypothetical protein